jgi:DNA polymerase
LVDIGQDGVILQPEKSVDAAHELQRIREEIGDCTRCPLHEKRNSIVFGEGNDRARLMFVGEGPGADEDRVGRPFVGKAGQLLTRMITAMTLERTDVYIANVVKCRPPKNRDPEAGEIEICLPFLKAQIRAVQPDVIVTLGRTATAALLRTTEPMGSLRGQFHDYDGIPVMPTYHPSFLLHNENDRSWKAKVWSDLKQVMAFLGITVPRSGVKK